MMDVLKALATLRDERSPQDDFVFAAEYLNLYRESNFVVHYCQVLCEYVYIELTSLDMFYLDFIAPQV